MKTGEGKLRYHLVPIHAMEGMVLSFEEGAQKYVEDDWKKLNVDSLLDAAERHITAIRKGEILDPDTKIQLKDQKTITELQHAYKAMASLAMVADLLKTEQEIPDPLPIRKERKDVNQSK